MDIKLIAVDMDGTFLTTKNTYDRELFKKFYNWFKARGGKFVVASGNQYFQLKSFFEDYQDELIYVAENGALIIDNQEEIHCSIIDKEVAMSICDEVSKHKEIMMVVCGRECAYIKDTTPKEFFDFTHLYYHHQEWISDYHEIDDKILKFALVVPEDRAEEFMEICRHFSKNVIPVYSGHGCIDLIVPGHNKGTAIEKVCQRYNIEPEECMAFGDGGNDIEMLEYVKYSYAMENAQQAVKDVCSYNCGNHEEGAVVKELIKLME